MQQLEGIRRNILKEVDAHLGLAELALLTVDHLGRRGIRMTTDEFADFFLTVFEARRKKFPLVLKVIRLPA